MKIGAASATVTLTLAAVLVLLSQNTAPGRADRPVAENPTDKQEDVAVQPKTVAVRLPPPPAAPMPAPRAEAAEIVKPAPSGRPPLKPTPADPSPPVAVVTPLAATPPPTPEKTPEAAPETANSLLPQVVTPTAKSEGRALLRMLEAGEGPVIEIAWPSSPAERARLYGLFTRCYGMQTALLQGHGRLFVANGARGAAWQVNRDAISGFVRQPTGALTATERNVISDIETHHGLRGGAPVRVFPRRVDATLLGGLRQIVGKDYTGRKTIRARYWLDGGRISVVDISTDGTARTGTVVLSPPGRCG